MITVDRFRAIALGMPEAVESAHMGHPDFRIGGKIFATLQPAQACGVVKLTPEQQARLLGEHPETFAMQNGAWGRQGWTTVRLDDADEEAVGEAVTLAWQNLRQPAGRTRSRHARR
jgi:hypothetical protein